mgnify:FL=1
MGRKPLMEMGRIIEEAKKPSLTSDMIVKVYDESGSIRKTADALHCGESTVRKALRLANVKIKSAGRPPRVTPS